MTHGHFSRKVLVTFFYVSILNIVVHGLIPNGMSSKSGIVKNIAGKSKNLSFNTFCHLSTKRVRYHTKVLSMSTFDKNNNPEMQTTSPTNSTLTDFSQISADEKNLSLEDKEGNIVGSKNEQKNNFSVEQKIQSFLEKWKNSKESSFQLPPLLVEDQPLLFYDVFLLVNLSLSISFWVVHRMSFFHIGTALSEGSLLCIIWIISGLYHGSFLYSAVDGHYGSSSEEGGPKSAGMLGLSTFITTANIRIVVALLMALIEHRPVGSTDGELLMPLEISFGILLMSSWRALHSYSTPRI